MAAMSQFLGTLMGPMGTVIGMGDGRPDNTLTDMQALTKAHAEARAKRLAASQGSLGHPTAPSADPRPSPPISGISPGYQDIPAAPAAPPAPPQMPWWASVDMAKMLHGGGFPAAQAPQSTAQAPPTGGAPVAPQAALDAAAAPVNAPQAPAQPDTGFFMRNAMMQHDPMTGQMIDPSAAESVRGPDLISKMMAYLHGKASA